MWNKYDHIFCPEYNIGAMENIGAVTVNDTRSIFKENASKIGRSRYLCVIAHELVHSWFGDLVTMKWWNDLWLKESFADYLAYFVVEKI